MNIFVYLSVNGGGCQHLDIEHSFVIIHPLHAWKLNLQEWDWTHWIGSSLTKEQVTAGELILL